MKIAIWKSGKFLESRDLETFTHTGKIYARYRDVPYPLQADYEIWLDGKPPQREAQKDHIAPPIPPPCVAKATVVQPIKPSGVISGKSAANSSPTESQRAPQTAAGRIWDAEQWAIISAPASARILVNACPGSGKTAAACARVAYLLEQENCNPDGIWLLSFTRVAVAEIHDRLSKYLSKQERAAQAHLASLDSFAWQINKGFDATARLNGSFEDNMRNAIELLRKSPELQEWMRTLTHLVVDEAQDITGIRADLLVEVLKNLSPECGVTVLSDDAQAIYGFTNDAAETGQSGKIYTTLPEIIRGSPNPFETRSLARVYRAASENLRELFTEVRSEIVNDTVDSADSWRMICQRVKLKAHSSDESGFDPLRLGLAAGSEHKQEIFALFRTRKDVLLAAMSFPDETAFRLHLGGIRRALPVWLGLFPLICKPPYLYYEDLEQELAHNAGLYPDKVWKILGGKENSRYVRLSELERISEYSLDFRLLKKELGMAGPLLGTIHASKGREVDCVHLYLSEQPGRDYREECRVIFVGATRARKKLEMHVNLAEPKKRGTANGRSELGFEEEIKAATLAGKEFYDSQAQVRARQETLRRLAIRFLTEPAPVSARAVLQDSRYELQTKTGEPLCFLDNSSSTGLKNCLKRGVTVIGNIRIMDIVTCKAEPGVRLHEPWNRFRFILKPRIIAYPV